MSLFKKKAEVQKKTGSGNVAQLDAPWLRAGRAYDDTFLRLAAQVANWRMFAFFCLLIAVFSVVGLIYVGAQSKFVPMLVEVDKLGRTLAVRALTGDDAITDSKRLVYREMFDLIESLRTVTTDTSANKMNINRGFSRLTGAAATYAKQELSNPNEIGATKTVQILVRVALPLSKDSWQVEWEELSFRLDGQLIGTEKWKASLKFNLTPSGDEQSIRENPIGFMVTDLNWMKVI